MMSRRIFNDITKLVSALNRGALADFFDFRTDFAEDPVRAMKKHGTRGLEAKIVLRYTERLQRFLDPTKFPDNLHALRATVEEIKEECQDRIERAEISQTESGAIYRALMETELNATEKVLETMQLVSRYLNEIA